MMHSFTMFTKRIENCTDAAEAAGVVQTNTQVTNKVFSVILKSEMFHDRVQEKRGNLLRTNHSLILNSVFQ